MLPSLCCPARICRSKVGMEDVRSRVGDRMCLAGGMQALHLDSGTPELVSVEVRRVLSEAGPKGVILRPTSAPLEVPLPGRIVENYRALFETAASIRP